MGAKHIVSAKEIKDQVAVRLPTRHVLSLVNVNGNKIHVHAKL